MLLTVIMHIMYRLKARHHKSGEKRRHFSYPDYFTYLEVTIFAGTNVDTSADWPKKCKILYPQSLAIC